MIQPEVGRPLVYTDYDPRGQLAIPDFLRLLEAYAPERAAQLRSGHPALVKALERGQRLVTERRYQEAQVWRAEIIAALGALAPDGTYFLKYRGSDEHDQSWLRSQVQHSLCCITVAVDHKLRATEMQGAIEDIMAMLLCDHSLGTKSEASIDHSHMRSAR